jgi:hypothetical protein
MRKWWFISSLGTEFIPTTLCITWKVKLVGPFIKEEQRGIIIKDLNIGNRSISSILLQYFCHHVIPHNTFPTTTCPTTRYLVWSYIRSIWNGICLNGLGSMMANHLTHLVEVIIYVMLSPNETPQPLTNSTNTKMSKQNAINTGCWQWINACTSRNNIDDLQIVQMTLSQRTDGT